MSNDQKVSAVRLRKVLKVFIIIFAILTIGLALCTLIFKLNVIYALIALIIESILTRYRSSIDPKVK